MAYRNSVLSLQAGECDSQTDICPTCDLLCTINKLFYGPEERDQTVLDKVKQWKEEEEMEDMGDRKDLNTREDENVDKDMENNTNEEKGNKQ